MAAVRAYLSLTIALTLASLGVDAVAQDGSRTVLDGVFTAAQATRGEQTFKQACTACHTVEKMTGNRFRAKWGDGTAGDVFDFMSNAMPEGDPGSLEPEEYASILAFLLRASGYPSGERELPADKSALLELRIVPLPAGPQ